jgi:hypothetical protein
MLQYLRVIWKIFFYFPDYRHCKTTLFSVLRWLSQFPSFARNYIFLLLDHIIYFSEKTTIKSLVKLNKDILDNLRKDGVGLDKVIYVAFDSAGSSSHVMLNLLRDAENLERKGATLIGSREAELIQEKTSKIGSGAIIYVDDFSGTGKQFTRNRAWSAQFIVGSFSEFFLAPVICEEAYQKIDEVGVFPVASHVHTVAERPLHRDSNVLSNETKNLLVNLCHEIENANGLGFKKLATMVVFYRNSPNTMPLLFRGNLKQQPYKGLFPRSDDLPF